MASRLASLSQSQKPKPTELELATSSDPLKDEGAASPTGMTEVEKQLALLRQQSKTEPKASTDAEVVKKADTMASVVEEPVAEVKEEPNASDGDVVLEVNAGSAGTTKHGGRSYTVGNPGSAGLDLETTVSRMEKELLDLKARVDSFDGRIEKKRTLTRADTMDDKVKDTCIGRYFGKIPVLENHEYEKSTHRYLVYFGEHQDINSFLIGATMWFVQQILYAVLWREANSQILEDYVSVEIPRLACLEEQDVAGKIFDVTEDNFLTCPAADEDSTSWYYTLLPVGLLSVYVQSDFVACASILFGTENKASRFRKFMTLVVLCEAGMALCTGLLWSFQGINKGSGYDAIVNSIGVLFIHELDEELFESIEKLNNSILTKWFKKCCMYCPCCENFGALVCTWVFIAFVAVLGSIVSAIALKDVPGGGEGNLFNFSPDPLEGQCQLMTYEGAVYPFGVCLGTKNESGADASTGFGQALQQIGEDVVWAEYSNSLCQGASSGYTGPYDVRVDTVSRCNYITRVTVTGGCKTDSTPLVDGFTSTETWSSVSYIQSECNKLINAADDAKVKSFSWECNDDGSVAIKSEYEDRFCQGNPTQTRYPGDGSAKCDSPIVTNGNIFNPGTGTVTQCFNYVPIDSTLELPETSSERCPGECNWLPDYNQNSVNETELFEAKNKEECIQAAYFQKCDIAQWSALWEKCWCQIGLDKSVPAAGEDAYWDYYFAQYDPVEVAYEACHLLDYCPGYEGTSGKVSIGGGTDGTSGSLSG